MPDPEASSAHISPLRWRIVSALFLATVLNYLDRQVLSVTAPVLRVELGLDAVAYSRVVFCFLTAYTVMQAVAGRLIDRAGARIGLAATMAWWSAAAALHALAASTLQLGIFRFLLGAGEAGNWPAAVKAVRQNFAEKDRALAIGIFNSGSAVGAIVAPPLIAWLTLQFSWRAAFAVTGIAGFLWLIPWLRIAPPDRPAAGLAADGNARWRSLLARREVLGLMAARFFCDSVWWFYVFWLPDYLSRARGFSLAMIGLTAWLPFLTAGLGNAAGGWASGHLARRGMDTVAARKAVIAASALVMATAAVTTQFRSAAVAVAVVSLVTFAYSCWATNVLTLPADLLPGSAVASAVGLCGTAAGAGGMLSTLAVGWAVEHSSYLPVFVAAGIAPLLALASLLALVRSAPRAA